MPKFDIALLVTLDAPTYEDALRDADHLAAALGDSAEESISAVLDYAHDREGHRILYLHPAS